MAPARTEDPLLGFNFSLEIQGVITGYFTECSGIGSENEVIDHKVGDDAGREVTRKIPGRLKWGDVSLKRGITNDMQIWDWRDNVVNGDMGTARKNGSIVMLDRNYTAVARWNFESGWPSKVSGPQLKADSNEFGLEELVIVHEGIYRDS